MKNFCFKNLGFQILGIVMMIPYACSLGTFFDSTARQPEMFNDMLAVLDVTKNIAVAGFIILGVASLYEIVIHTIRHFSKTKNEEIK